MENKIDLFSAEFRNNPYPFYERMLSDDVTIIDTGANPGDSFAVFVTRYDHVSALLRDPRMTRESADKDTGNTWTPPDSWKPYFNMVGDWMLFRDPPNHTRLRGLVNKAFTPNAINHLRAHIQAIAHQLVDDVQARGQFDLVADYAFELPVRVIAEMLGVPAEERDQFKTWSNCLAEAIDFNNGEGVMERAGVAAQEITDYMRGLIAAKRNSPTNDILTGLVQAEQDGDRLSEDEVIATCGLLLFAGHETTVNLIGNGALNLLRHPDQLALLQRHPELTANAVEEILRYESPVQATSRRASEEINVGNAKLERGWEVFLMMGAANRDPLHYEAPNQFNIQRQDVKHLSFGGGIHYCVGAALARMEGEIGLSTLFQRLPSLKLETDSPEWRGLMILRGLKSLPVSI